MLSEKENFHVRRLSFKWFFRGKSLWQSVNGQMLLHDKWQGASRSEKCLRCLTKRPTHTGFVPRAALQTGCRQCLNKCYISHAEFMYEKPVMLNVSCYAACGAVVFNVSGRAQLCFLGHMKSHLSHPVSKEAVETAASGQALCFTATCSVTGTFLTPFWPQAHQWGPEHAREPGDHVRGGEQKLQ